jgi:hypothetical protein
MLPRDREQEQLRAIEDQIASDQVVQDGLSGDVHVAVEAGAITVTKPGTSYSVTYTKPEDSPHLVMTKSWLEPSLTTPAVSEFRARAFQAAVDKARELGWIV